MDNKDMKLFAIKHAKWSKFMFNMHQNTFGVSVCTSLSSVTTSFLHRALTDVRHSARPMFSWIAHSLCLRLRKHGMCGCVICCNNFSLILACLLLRAF